MTKGSLPPPTTHTHTQVTTNASEADYFYVWMWFFHHQPTPDSSHPSPAEVVAALKAAGPWWERKGGRDHLFLTVGDQGFCEPYLQARKPWGSHPVTVNPTCRHVCPRAS